MFIPDDLDEEMRLLAQLPPAPAPVPFDMGDDFPLLGKPEYITDPPNLRTIALLKTRYDNKRSASVRARELCLATGERVFRIFETNRAYVAHVYKPLPVTAEGGF